MVLVLGASIDGGAAGRGGGGALRLDAPPELSADCGVDCDVDCGVDWFFGRAPDVLAALSGEDCGKFPFIYDSDEPEKNNNINYSW